jgi:5-aminopentanamidase
MRVALHQMNIQLGQLTANLEQITKRIRQSTDQGIELAVFPECALSGYCFESRIEALASAVELTGPEVARLIAAAQDAQTRAVVGLLLRDGGQLFNAQVLVGPEGMIGTYRKIHLPALGVDRFVDPGDRPPQVFETGGARIGLAICYDSSFPELSRVLALEGADIIALSTNWPAAAHRVAKSVPPCRSLENHLYFVAANRVGDERGFSFCGLSSIFGPDGVEYARSPDNQESVLIADLDLQLARQKRIERTPGHVVDLIADRRPSFYRKIVD